MGYDEGVRAADSEKARFVMIPMYRYCVTIRIKVHTSPLREIEYEKEGVFIKETKSYLIFDSFRVRKENVINISRRS